MVKNRHIAAILQQLKKVREAIAYPHDENVC